MKHRQPYDLKELIRFYNTGMIVINLYGFILSLPVTNFGIDTWKCLNINRNSREIKDIFLLILSWCFLVSRLIEFSDTVFFVLRKKQTHISTLHVFHHSFVPIFVWITVKFAPVVTNGFFPFINCFVHIIMYTYYTMSTYPKLKPYLWWKKYLTRLQMTQFVLVIINSMRIFVMTCNFPPTFLYLNAFVSLIFLIMFASYYLKSYGTKNNIKELNNNDYQKIIKAFAVNGNQTFE